MSVAMPEDLESVEDVIHNIYMLWPNGQGGSLPADCGLVNGDLSPHPAIFRRGDIKVGQSVNLPEKRWMGSMRKSLKPSPPGTLTRNVSFAGELYDQKVSSRSYLPSAAGNNQLKEIPALISLLRWECGKSMMDDASFDPAETGAVVPGQNNGEALTRK
ncbi:hypothetical protein Bbelb_086570 [Branchiostoma belcheri]|nr:hypothetical protein Bbelb_086570 [Branchiostoma belcheri]